MKRALISLLFVATALAQNGREVVTIDTKTGVVQNSIMDASGVTLTVKGFTIKDASGIQTVVTGAVSGTTLGATGNLIGFLGATPVAKQTGNIFTALTAYGLVNSPTLTISNITTLQATLDAKTDKTITVNGQPLSANVTVTKSDIGLGSADNTSDANKPVSIAQQTALDLKANDSATVHKTGTETITGTKTFSLSPSVPDNSFAESKVTGLIADLSAKANDASVLHISGIETITGSKTFAAASVFDAAAARGVILQAPLPNPSAPTVTSVGSVGVSTWSYKIVVRLSDGTTTTAASSAGSVTSGFPTLSSTNYNAVSWSAVSNASSYDVYRTAAGTSPATLGRIATGLTATSYNDQGAAGDSSTAPTVNATGGITLNGGPIILPLGNTTRALADKLAEAVSVKDYGAIGDASHDDAPNFAAAIAALPQGSKLYIPPGNYRFASAVTIPKAFSIIGAGQDYGGAQIMVDNGVSGFIVSSGVNNVTFEKFRMQSLNLLRGAGTVGIKAIATDLANSIGYLTITDVEVMGFESGIDNRFCQVAVLRNLRLLQNKIGLYQKRSVNVDIYSGAFAGNTLWGAFIDGDSGFVQYSAGTKMFGTQLTNNGSLSGGNLKVLYNDQFLGNGLMIDVPSTGSVVGARIEGCTGGTISGSYVGSSAGGPGIIVQSTTNFSVTNSKIVGCVYGVRFISSKRCVLSGNEVLASAGYDVWINDELLTGSNANIVSSNTLGSAATTTYESVLEQNTNQTIVHDNAIAGSLTLSNPELAHDNYNYVDGSVGPAMISWTPTITTQTGTITTLGTVVAQYHVDRKWVTIHMEITITTNGTGAGYVKATLPSSLPAKSSRNYVFSSREDNAVGFTCNAGVSSGLGSNLMSIQKYDGTYPAGNGYRLTVDGRYEIN